MNLHKKNRKIIKTIGAVFILALIILGLNFFKKEIRNSFYYISSPFQSFFWTIGNKASDFLANSDKIKKESVEILAKYNLLLSETADLKEVEKENAQLKQALNIGLQKDFKLVFSNIIGKDVSGGYILIDKGEKDGIKKNMPIISSEKAIMGKVYEVYNNFSKVMLIFDKKSSFDAVIPGKDISGIIKGDGEQKIIFDLIPRDKDVAREDIISTSAIGGIFPPGILVGRVLNVRKSDVDPFQTIEVEPAFNIAKQEKVFIIKEY